MSKTTDFFHHGDEVVLQLGDGTIASGVLAAIDNYGVTIVTQHEVTRVYATRPGHDIVTQSIHTLYPHSYYESISKVEK